MSVYLHNSNLRWAYSRPANRSQALSFWVYCTVSGSLQVPIGVSSTGLGELVAPWFGHPTLGTHSWLLSTSNTGGNITTNTQAQFLNTWTHIFAIWKYNGATTDMAIYLDGNIAGRGLAAGKANIPSGVNEFCVGATNRSGSDFPLLNGMMTQVAMWEGFTDFGYQDIIFLSKGAKPWRIKKNYLTRYIPFDGSLDCEINGPATASTGTTILPYYAEPHMDVELRLPFTNVDDHGPWLESSYLWPKAAGAAPAAGFKGLSLLGVGT